MSKEQTRNDKQMDERSNRDAVMDSLLVSLHEQPNEREQRVQRMLARYPQREDKTRIPIWPQALAHHHAPVIQARTSRLHMVLALAAMMLVMSESGSIHTTTRLGIEES